VNIYFKVNQFLASHRSELYGFADFLANCGGLLGLCLGISVISLFEIVYFYIIRLWVNLRRSKGNISAQKHLHFKPKTTKISVVLKELIKDYSNRTTIHGIKYIGDEKLSLYERLWWAIIVTISAICCGLLISDTVRHYDQTPLFVSYTTTELLINQVNHT
jgi:Amiloride-sensitive sodium channel